MQYKEYKIDSYTFKNYISLDENDKKLVLKNRNKNRKWMLNQEIISLKSHLSWIESLKVDNSKLYFLVYKDEKPFISIFYHDIKDKEAYWGYFLIDENYKSEVLKIEKIIIDFAFDELNLDRLLCINDSKNHVIKIHQFFGFKEIEKRVINNQEYTVMLLEKKGK